MYLCFLKPNELIVPPSITILKNFGEEVVVLQDGTVAAKGEVIYIKAEKDAVIKWLHGMDIWVGYGLIGFKKERII
jgi:ABC-type uncharacterized transport system ATPase subunit